MADTLYSGTHSTRIAYLKLDSFLAKIITLQTYSSSFDTNFALLAIDLPKGGRIGAFENMQFDLTSDKYAKTRVHQTNLPLLKLSKLKIPSKPVEGIYFSLIYL
jgi:hypothetical protein